MRKDAALFGRPGSVIKSLIVIFGTIALIRGFGIWNVYAAESESDTIQLNVTTNPFVNYGKASELFPGVIDASQSKGLCSVNIGVEGHAENVRIDVTASDITITGKHDERHHVVFEIGSLDGADSRSVTLVNEAGAEAPHLEISVTVDDMGAATWSCDFDTETKARAILLADPKGGDLTEPFKNDLEMMEKVFQKCWYNGEPVETISVWNPDSAEAGDDVSVNYFNDDALGQLTGKGIDGNDLTYIYLNAHGSEESVTELPGVTIEQEGAIGDVTYSELINWLDENVPGQVVIIADSCYSGGLIETAAEQSAVLSAGFTPEIYDRFIILTAVSPDTSASMWSEDVGFSFDFERWPGGYGWFTHDIYRVIRGSFIPASYYRDYFKAKSQEGVFSVKLFYDILHSMSIQGPKIFTSTIDPQVYGRQFKPLFVVDKEARLAVAPCPVNIQENTGNTDSHSNDISAALEAYGDLVRAYREAIEAYRADGTYPENDMIDDTAVQTMNGGGTSDEELKAGLYDLDDDGIPELFFGIYDQHHFPEHQTIWAIYTYSDGKVVPLFISTGSEEKLSAQGASGMLFMSEMAMMAYYTDKNDQFYMMFPGSASFFQITKEQAEASASASYLYILNLQLDYVLDPDTEQAVRDGTIGTTLHYYDFSNGQSSACPQGDIEQRWRQDTRQSSIPMTEHSEPEGGCDELKSMLTGYYWYGGIPSPQIYVFSTDDTFVCQSIAPGRSDLSYDSNMTVSPEDFVLSGLTGTWELDGSTLQLTYDSGRMENYQYYTSDADGPEENWSAYFFGEWSAVGVLGNTITEHQTLGRINRK